MRSMHASGWNKVWQLTWSLRTGALLLLAALEFQGQLARADGAGDYILDVWDRESGLPNTTVTAVAQTRDGYLWVGTHNGLARFDGARSVVFDPENTPALKHARVVGLLVDSEGRLWINTYDGALTSWANGCFHFEWRGWEGVQVVQVFSQTNRLVFATRAGQVLFRETGKNGAVSWWSMQPPGRATGTAYVDDGSGTLWYGARDGTAGRLMGTNFSVFSGPDSGLAGRHVNCVASDGHGQLWAGTDAGLFRREGGKFELCNPTNREVAENITFLTIGKDGSGWAIANRQLRRFARGCWLGPANSWGERFSENLQAVTAYEDHAGVTWLRHYGLGLFRGDADGTLRRISSNDGALGGRVSCWLEDREANMWAGVDRGGLVRLRKKRFEVVGLAEGLTGQGAVSVCEDASGGIWIGSYGNGLNRWQDGALTRFMLAEGPNRGFFFSACPGADGKLWASAGREDLAMFEKGAVSLVSPGAHGVKALLVDRQGRLWIGKSHWVSCLEQGKVKTYGNAAGLDNTDFHALGEDAHGAIWAGGGNGVLYRFNGERFTSFKPDDLGNQQAIWSICPDADDTIWIGTFRGGLLRFKEGHFTRFTSSNGLPSDVICQIVDDHAGRLWMGSHQGVFNVPKSVLRGNPPATLPSVNYGLFDGLPTLECSGGYQPSSWQGHDGRLWFATLKGAVSIHPDDLPVKRPVVPVVLESLLVEGKTLRKVDAAGEECLQLAGDSATLQIGPGRSQVEFRYTAPSFGGTEKVFFRYQLEGLDTGWVDAGTRRFAQYSHLRPGSYRFRVTACNKDGVWNEKEAGVALEVLPHFWETWWFIAVSSGALAVALAAVVRLIATRKFQRRLERLEQQRAVERDRARIAKDIHDDLGAGLTQILLQSSLARREIKQDEQPNLLQISQTAQDLIRGMDEIVWAVNPQNDTLEGIGSYISKFAFDYLTVAGVRCRLELPETFPPRAVSSETRHNVFLAIKEALNNVLKHSNASEVWLKLTVRENGVLLTVHDNGKGFVFGAKPEPERNGQRTESGHGLGNMARRLESVGGRCAILTQPGQGTTVELEFPC
jgi:signal transduction histidine kinase/ligand-binding sensor domain-containing protein